VISESLRGRLLSEPELADVASSVAAHAHLWERLIHPGGEPAISIHAYSPPLRSMGSYVVEPTGALRRHALRPHEELRPLAPAAA